MASVSVGAVSFNMTPTIKKFNINADITFGNDVRDLIVKPNPVFTKRHDYQHAETWRSLANIKVSARAAARKAVLLARDLCAVLGLRLACTKRAADGGRRAIR